MHFFYAERLEEKQSLTSSWPKELKLQPIENEKFDDEDDLDDEDEDDYDEEEYEYDDEDDYEDEDYDDEYYDEEFYENEVRQVQLLSRSISCRCAAISSDLLRQKAILWVEL